LAVKTVDRTFLQGQSAELFRAAIKSQATRDPYERRLIGFLKRMDAKSADAFIEFARNNPVLSENKIIAFLSSERARADRGEISAGTINNWVKAARLFLEMSDVQLNWKKIRKVLPRARRYALDRVPTIDELREILDAADLRGKALYNNVVISGQNTFSINLLKVKILLKLAFGTRSFSYMYSESAVATAAVILLLVAFVFRTGATDSISSLL
jgi:hypothetical protein